MVEFFSTTIRPKQMGYEDDEYEEDAGGADQEEDEFGDVEARFLDDEDVVEAFGEDDEDQYLDEEEEDLEDEDAFLDGTLVCLCSCM